MMSVSDYSTTAGNNKAISGINIAEGCAPGNLNNAIRQLMADVRALKDVLDSGVSEAGALARQAVNGLAGLLPLAGGTMSGEIRTSRGQFIGRTVETGSLAFMGGTEWSGGSARLTLFGGQHGSQPGMAVIHADNGTKSTNFTFTPEGTISVGSKTVLFSGDKVSAAVTADTAVSATTATSANSAATAQKANTLATGNVFTAQNSQTAVSLPNGGTWAYMAFHCSTNGGSGGYSAFESGKANGGTSISPKFSYLTVFAVKVA